jgi:dTDP-glucose 4,6-dehydratase
MHDSRPDPSDRKRLSTPDSRLDELMEFIADPRGAAHDFRYALDCAKIKAELGWEPEVDFKEGLRRTVEWYLANQDWVKGVVTGEYQEYYRRVYGADRSGLGGKE